jgi:2-polyprenyl-6-methoxyphenol hydroxylase-like FAD-dependent oxidoreductase
MRSYVPPEGIVPLKTFQMVPLGNPTPDRPLVSSNFNSNSNRAPTENIQADPIALGQDVLEGVLRTALKEKYSCEVEFGTRLVSLTQDAEGVDAVIAKGDAVLGQEDTQRFDFLVGADGARGIVRKQLGLAFLGESRPSIKFIIADVRVEGIDENVSYQFLSTIPCSADSVHLVALACLGRL